MQIECRGREIEIWGWGRQIQIGAGGPGLGPVAGKQKYFKHYTDILTVAKINNKTPELCHAVFIFNFEHIQHINLIFLLLTLNMYLSVGHKIKPTKQLKCTLNNGTVSLKHVATCNMSKSI